MKRDSLVKKINFCGVFTEHGLCLGFLSSAILIIFIQVWIFEPKVISAEEMVAHSGSRGGHKRRSTELAGNTILFLKWESHMTTPDP